MNAFDRPDWGLDNASDRDVDREHACLRVQVALLTPFGLREVFAPTTSFRDFYDQLGDNGLGNNSNNNDSGHRGDKDPVAVVGVQRAGTQPWAPHLRTALEATSKIAQAVKPFASTTSLWSRVQEEIAPHPTGLGGAPWFGGRRCGDCAWRYVGGRGSAIDRCHQTGGERVDPSWAACDRWESASLDCGTCGACCREGYDSVTITKRESVVRSHPDLVVDRGSYIELARADGRCAALEIDAGNSDSGVGYRCAIYQDRPRPCRDLEVGGPHCLTARKRVGLTI